MWNAAAMVLLLTIAGCGTGNMAGAPAMSGSQVDSDRYLMLASEGGMVRLQDLGGDSPAPPLRLSGGPAGMILVEIEGFTGTPEPRLILPGFRQADLRWTLADGRLRAWVPHDGHQSTLTLVPEARPSDLAPPYYDFNRLRRFVETLPRHPHLHRQAFAHSHNGREIYRLYIEDHATPTWIKKTVVLTARVRGNGSLPSYVIEGLVRYLLGLGETQPDPEILATMRFVIYPMVNPDGVDARVSVNAEAEDLERGFSFQPPDRQVQPLESFELQQDIERVKALFPISMVLDLRATARGRDGGATYPLDRDPTFMTQAAFRECLKWVTRLRECDRAFHAFHTAEGVRGTAMVELWRRMSVPVLTLYYDDTLPATAADALRRSVHLARAACKSVNPLVFPGQEGQTLVQIPLAGQSLSFQIEDLDQNQDPLARETLQAWALDLSSADMEPVWLTELGENTGRFYCNPALTLSTQRSQARDGILTTSAGGVVLVFYPDPDYPPDFSLKFAAIR
jgi:hypothetical protein